MSVLIVVVVVVFAATIAALAVVAARRTTKETGAAVEPDRPQRMRPVLVDFHVRGEEAHVFFGVPVPPGDVGERLRHLLEHEALAVLREKRDHGLPLDVVTTVVVHGRRGDESVEVTRLDLPEPGTIPEVSAPDLVPRDRASGYDPLAALGEQSFDVLPGVEVKEGEGPLPPIGAVVDIPSPIEDGLRARGLDPAALTLQELTLGLLELAGYQVTREREGFAGIEGAAVYRAARAGSSTVVVVVEHTPDGHPELPERAINEMVVTSAQGNMAGILVTDKYGPYVMYEKERKSKVRFITRERLQAFVDSFALG